MNRKGQSEIITTILLILIVLAAVVVVWIVISNIIDTDDTLACAEIKMRIVSADATADTVRVQRMAGAPEVTVSNIVVTANGATATVTAQTLAELEEKSYAVTSGFAAGDIIKVAPIVQNAQGKDVKCNFIGQIKAT